MKCRLARVWLLRAENPGDLPHAPPAVVDHVRACPRCRRVLRQVRQLEERWRELPLPAGVEAAKAAFLERHAPRTLPMPRHRVWLRTLVGAAVAAALLLAVSLVSWQLLQPEPVQSAENVLDRLIDWNLTLSHTEDAQERAKLFKEKHAEFAALLKKGDVPDDQKELAENLMENADWLARSDEDPLEEANRFSQLADKMVDKLSAAGDARDARTVNQLAKSYSKLAQKGINDNLNVAAQKKDIDAKKRQAELKHVLAQEQKRLEKLQKVMLQSPTQSHGQLRQAVSVTGNHQLQKKKTSPKK